ncbi:MAG: TIGR02594 family protein [Xanthobacteraceae bacterium]
MTLSLVRFARFAFTTSALVLALPAAQGQARPSHTHPQLAVTIALPLNAEVTDFSSRRRNRHVSQRYVRHHYAYRRAWNRTARYGAVRHYARGTRATQIAAASPFGIFGQPATPAVTPRRMRVAEMRARRPMAPNAPMSFGFGGGGVVAEARRYLGTNPTGRGSLWCATFMNMVLERSGHRGTGSNLAWSFARYGQRVSGPQVGAIAVMGHHVGIVSGLDARGNPIIISGNYQRRVAEAVFPRGRIAAYVMPM